MLNAVGRIYLAEVIAGNYDSYHGFLAALESDPKRAAEQVAAFGRQTFEGAPGIGKQVLAAIRGLARAPRLRLGWGGKGMMITAQESGLR